MKQQKKYISGIIAFFIALVPTIGQVSFTAKTSSSKVGINQQFTVTYSLTGAKSEAFERPSFTGFRVVGQSSITGGGSMQMFINGQLISNNEGEQSWTFTLIPTTTGTFDIGPARVKVAGEWISSPSLKVTVVATNQPPSPSQMQTQSQTKPQQTQQPTFRQGQQPQTQTTTQGGLKSDDVFIRATVDKNTAWIGEPIIVTYKIYTKVSIPSFAMNKIPAFDGFWSENLIDPNAKPQQSEEIINGQRYTTALLRKIILYPQRSGNLTIPPLEVEIIARIIRQRQQQNMNDWFDQMFSNFFTNPFGYDPFSSFPSFGTSFEDIKTTISSNSINILVKELPTKNKTADFSGQVGKYSLDAWIDKDRVLVDDAVTLFVKISGNGNMSLLEAPEIEFPKGLDVYDPQVEDNTKLTTSGHSGNKVFSYLFIPRTPGTFKIPPVQFNYFDLGIGDYKTLTSDAFTLQVVGQNGSRDYSGPIATEQDIRYIMLSNSAFKKINSFFFGSFLHYLLFVIPLIAFVIFVIAYRRRMQLYADEQLLRYKKATKTAKKRLKKAANLLADGKINDFYEETARAIWAYLAHRFAIQQAELSVDMVIRRLAQSGVDEDVLTSLRNTLDFCEFIRFAPSAETSNPGDILKQAENTISRLEQHLQQSKRNKHKPNAGLALLLILLISASSINVLASEQKMTANEHFKLGNELYANGQYFEAIEHYQAIIDSGLENFETYYNLGNACFKTNQPAMAIYYYEKALQLKPGNSDARFNLNFVNNLLLSDALKIPEPFHIRLVNNIMKLLNPDGWAITGIVLFVFTLTLLLLFLLQPSQRLKRLFFYLAFFFALLTTISVYMGQRRYHSIIHPQNAIIMVSSTGVKSSPDISSADIYVAHAGMKVKILSSLGDWYEVRVPDGNKGWILKENLKLI